MEHEKDFLESVPDRIRHYFGNNPDVAYLRQFSSIPSPNDSVQIAIQFDC